MSKKDICSKRLKISRKLWVFDVNPVNSKLQDNTSIQGNNLAILILKSQLIMLDPLKFKQSMHDYLSFNLKHINKNHKSIRIHSNNDMRKLFENKIKI